MSLFNFGPGHYTGLLELALLGLMDAPGRQAAERLARKSGGE